jgi:hypothetical protein
MEIKKTPYELNWQETFEVKLSLAELTLIYAYAYKSGSTEVDKEVLEYADLTSDPIINGTGMYVEIRDVLRERGLLKP